MIDVYLYLYILYNTGIKFTIKSIRSRYMSINITLCSKDNLPNVDIIHFDLYLYILYNTDIESMRSIYMPINSTLSSTENLSNMDIIDFALYIKGRPGLDGLSTLFLKIYSTYILLT